MTRTVVVTCGATVPFPGLVEAILDLNFLHAIHERWGFGRVIIQYGKGYNVEFEKRMRFLGSEPERKDTVVEISKKLGVELEFYGRVGGVEICGFAFTTAIQDLLRTHADVVVSHAGTGSILDALRLQKRLVVVANTGLMDNHQMQITDRLESRGHLVAAHETSSAAVLEAISVLERQAPVPLASGTSAVGFTNLLMNVATS
ncbi:LAFA_0A03202g1_1 [Lachancea sp. 'fantastica']|nr:LAFA_0A03202g1_1 [Lachancea sp. 'fantastica']